MRCLSLGLVVAVAALTFVPLASAHEGDEHEHEPGVTREEVEQKKREVREMERELRKKERSAQVEQEERRVARRGTGRMWLGVGAGVAYGAVDIPCQSNSFGDDCREEGVFNSYTANITVTGRDGALRLRGLRQADKGDDSRTPYETAALIGTRFGRSDWYGLAGYGRIRHADDQFTEERAGGFAWEILFAPSSESLTGLELSFQGNAGEDVDFVGFNIGMRVGALR
jgi:hypothetical protein